MQTFGFTPKMPEGLDVDAYYDPNKVLVAELKKQELRGEFVQQYTKIELQTGPTTDGTGIANIPNLQASVCVACHVM